MNPKEMEKIVQDLINERLSLLIKENSKVLKRAIEDTIVVSTISNELNQTRIYFENLIKVIPSNFEIPLFNDYSIFLKQVNGQRFKYIIDWVDITNKLNNIVIDLSKAEDINIKEIFQKIFETGNKKEKLCSILNEVHDVINSLLQK